MFWRNKIKEIEHYIDESIDNGNDAHKSANLANSRASNLEIAMKETKDAINDLENRVKNKWETLTKRVETCEKANEMFIQALNEQRDVIAKIIKFLNNNSKTTTAKKKGVK